MAGTATPQYPGTWGGSEDVNAWRAVLSRRQRTVSFGHDDAIDAEPSESDASSAHPEPSFAASFSGGSSGARFGGRRFGAGSVGRSDSGASGPAAGGGGGGSFRPRPSSPLALGGGRTFGRFSVTAMGSAPSPLSLARSAPPEFRHDRFSVERVADEAESHADVARDLLDCPNTGHTWHGYLAQQQWRAAREAAREEEGFAADDMEGEPAPSGDRRAQRRSRTFAWLPNRPTSTETPEEDAREIASSVDIADDLLGTSRAPQWTDPGRGGGHGHSRRSHQPHQAHHHPSFGTRFNERSRQFGRFPQVGGAGHRGGYAPREPPARPPRTLASLFDQPADDDSDDDDMSADNADEEEEDHVASAEQRWLDTLAARHRASFGAAAAERGQHTWHGADAQLVEGWSQVLRARQAGGQAATAAVEPGMAGAAGMPRGPTCGR